MSLRNLLNIFALFMLAISHKRVLASDHKNKTELSVEAGPNIVSLRGSAPLSATKKNVRWSAGVSIVYNFNRKFSIRTIIAYERKGAKLPNTIGVIDSVGTSVGEVTPYLNYDYITLPIHIRYITGRRIKYFGCAGPYIGYLINREDVIRGENVRPFVPYKGKEFDKSWDLGLTTGIGILIPVNKQFYCSFEVRNNLGLLNVNRKKQYVNTVKTNAFNVLLGVTYQL